MFQGFFSKVSSGWSQNPGVIIYPIVDGGGGGGGGQFWGSMTTV